MKSRFSLFALPVLVLAAAPVARASVTARSYVQKGLVACYDGIDNAGTGTHDPAAVNWTDISGHGLDGALGPNLGWTEDGWTNAVDGSGVRVGAGLANAISLGGLTIQFACVPARDDARQSFFSDYQIGLDGAISVEHNDGNTSAGRLRFYREGSPNFSVLSSAVIPKDEFASVSVSASPSEQVFWLNGSTVFTNEAPCGAAAAGCASVIGGDPGRGNMAFRGVYHAFRAYDRALSEADVKVNAAIDAIRFDGADPADFALGGGYSFDGNGDLCVTVRAAAGLVDGAPGGTVRAAGGEAGAAAAETVAQYGEVALAATPAEGFVFVRWTGDTDAIASGAATDAAITVTAHSSLDLVAAFRAGGSGGSDLGDGSALTSRSYVRRGLAVQFDGMDNAGFGLHDDEAATWTDLTGNGNDGAVAATVAWTANGWTNAANGRPVVVGEGLARTTGSGAFTMQIACNPSRDSERQCFFGQYSNPGGFSLEHNNGSSSAGRVRFYCMNGGDYLSPAVVPKDSFTSLSCALAPSVQISWTGFETAYTNAAAFGTPSADVQSVVGGEFNRSAMAFRGVYHAFRLYDRVLSEPEMRVNAAIDAIRFDGASPADFELDGGFFFDAKDGLRVTVSAAVSDTGGGAVSAGGGAAGASASAVVQVGATVPLAATPDEGWVFVRWEGDTDLIADGCSARDAAVSADALSCGRLVAVFRRRTVGLDAYSCVRRGLVAHFDGIDNAGTRVHDPDAASWADLTGNGNDGTLAANVAWAEDGWVNAENCHPVSLGPGTVAPATASKTFTVQFAAKPSRGNARECFFGQYSAAGVSVEHNSGSVSDGRIRLYYNLRNVVDETYPDAKVAAGEWASVAVTSRPGEQTVWKNGTAAGRSEAALDGTPAANCDSTIGGDIVRPSMAFRGTYNVFRLYDRVLAEDEIKLNAAVDAVRFGGKTPAEVSPLPDGWSFDGNGTLLADIRAEARAGGRVRFEDGEAARSVARTVNADGLERVVLVAEPHPWCEFAGWTGDVDAIEEGSPSTASVLVDTTGPVSLVANFVRNGVPPTVVFVR